jgi:hypothetical protein
VLSGSKGKCQVLEMRITETWVIDALGQSDVTIS